MNVEDSCPNTSDQFIQKLSTLSSLLLLSVEGRWDFYKIILKTTRSHSIKNQLFSPDVKHNILALAILINQLRWLVLHQHRYWGLLKAEVTYTIILPKTRNFSSKNQQFSPDESGRFVPEYVWLIHPKLGNSVNCVIAVCWTQP